jgi:hypothetical protein
MMNTNLIWPSRLPRLLWMGRTCPCCRSIEFRSAEPEHLDRLFMLLSLRPIRCVNCWRRYYSLRRVAAR